MSEYYNTTSLTGAALSEAHKQTARQDDVLLQWFEQNPFKQVTRSELEALQVLNCPTASLVRSLNSLMKEGKIIKLDKMKPGEFGKPQHLWCSKFKTELF